MFELGLFEGITEARERRLAKNQEQDALRRQGEAKLYEYLLQSTDPQIKTLALSGIFESLRPGTKAKGLRGFMGEIEGGSIYPQLMARMNEEVPAPGAPPAMPGSAAMPAQAAVEPGAPPMPLGEGGGFSPYPDATFAAAPEPPPGPPPPLLEGRTLTGQPMIAPKHRRGTGVPTAEEIAEATAAAQLQARITTLLGALSPGATPEMRDRLVMGIGGAPMPTQRVTAGPMMADPNDPETPIPTSREPDGSLIRADTGAPVTGLVGWVKPTTGGRVTKTMEDPASPTGYSSVTYDPTGQEIFRVPVEYNPPPAYSGTTTFADPTSPTGRTVAGVNRQGGVGGSLGPAPAPEGQLGQEQVQAQALLTDIENAIKAAESATGFTAATRKKLTPQQIDAIVVERSRAAGRPYSTYVQVQEAARMRPTTAPAPGNTPSSTAERVLRRLQGQGGGR